MTDGWISLLQWSFSCRRCSRWWRVLVGVVLTVSLGCLFSGIPPIYGALACILFHRLRSS